MKAGQKYFFATTFLLIVLCTTVLAQGSGLNAAPIKDLGAKQNGNSIRVTWTSGSESGIKYYEVYRSTENASPFNICVRANIPLLGDNQLYTIDDNCDLYKTEGSFYYYKVRAVYSSDGSDGAFSDAVGTSYSSASSAAKRTWGSIKAMFR